jgi:hypothetical protein
MRRRCLLGVGAAAAALVLCAAAQSQPATFQLSTKVGARQAATMTIGTFPRGEFSFALRASSDGVKRLRLTQRRNGGRRFTVLRVPGPQATSACQGAAGSIICSGITTPATPAGRRWSFRFSNLSGRPMSLQLTIRWRRLTSAG